MADRDFATAMFEAAGFWRMPEADEIDLIIETLSEAANPQRIVDELAAGLAYLRSLKGDAWDAPHLNVFLHRLDAAKRQPAEADRQGRLI